MSHRFSWFMLLAVCALGSGGCMTPSAENITQSLPPIPGGESAGASSKVELPARDQARISLNLAEGMDKGGHPVEAIAFYEKARTLDPRLQAKIGRRLAILYDQLGETHRALAEYQQALKAAPRDADLLNSFGYYYYTRGNWAEAETHLRQAVAINPNHHRAWVNLGMTLGQQHRCPESLEAFAKTTGKAGAYSNLAFILATQGKRDEAKQYYRDALHIDPNLPIARLALAKLEKPEMPAPAGETPQAPRTAARVEALPDLGPIVVPEPGRGATAPGKAPLATP